MSFRKKFKDWMVNPRKEMIRMIKNMKNFRLKNMIIAAIVSLKRKREYSGETILKGHNFDTVLQALRKDGIYVFDQVLDRAEIDDLIVRLKDKDCFYAYNPSLGTFKKANPPDTVNTVNYPVNEYISEDLFIKILYDPMLLKIVQEYLGCKPVFNDVSFYWSILNRNKARDAQIYHRDSSDLKFLALALYFTDVNTTNDGPFCYVKTSAKSNKLHMAKLRHSDEEILSVFGKENELEVLGRKGSFALCDNFGFHRGKIPVDNERLVFFLHYGITNQKRDVPSAYYDVTDREKVEKLKKYSHLAGNAAFRLNPR